MTELIAYLHDCPIVSRHRPWPRVELAAERWRALVARLPQEEWELFALWGEPGVVHMCLRDPAPGTLAVLSLATRDGRYPSVGGARPGALRMERAARDLVGLEPEGLADRRDWLDHGAWPVRWPLSAAPIAAVPRRPTDYAFLRVDGEGLHQIAVGPIHAGIIEPGHFRFHANGETVVRLEERLGYVHKGTEKLMQGRTVDEAAKLAGRISGDATVAHAIAFARAVEAALDMRAPARADALRGLMAELERIANHLGDFGAICNDAAFTFLQAEATTLREDVLRVCGPAFGHRLMMDAVVPGGVAAELSADGARAIHELVRHIGPRFDALVTIYDDKPSLLDRTLGTGVLVPHLAQRFAAGGHVGRASGRSFDSRKSPGYPPYDRLEFTVPVLREGDVHARVWIRILEIRESLKLVDQLLATLPTGPICVELPVRAGEGIGIAEAFRGDVLTWVRLDDGGRVVRCFPRDPSWLQWPLLEAVIEGNIVADFPLCNKSFNCSYSGHDL